MSAAPDKKPSVPATVAVRPRLDLRYDVIQSKTPQLVGTRATKDEAVRLGEWAAERNAPCTLVLFGPDGATVEWSKRVEPSHPAAHGAHGATSAH